MVTNYQKFDADGACVNKEIHLREVGGHGLASVLIIHLLDLFCK